MAPSSIHFRRRVLALSCLVWLVSCQRHAPIDAAAAYRDARLTFEHGDLRGASEDAGRIAQRLEQEGRPDAYQFRVLQAEILVWQRKNKEALTLLGSMPGTDVPIAVVVRRHLLRARAAARLKGLDAAAEDLRQIDRLAPRVPELAAEIVYYRGALVFDRSPDEALKRAREALTLLRDEQQFLKATIQGNIGVSLAQRHQYADAVDAFNASFATARAIRARAVEGRLIGNLATVYLRMGELERAQEGFIRAETLAKELSLDGDVPRWLLNHGVVLLDRRNFRAARNLLEQALAGARQTNQPDVIAYALNNLAIIDIELNRLKEAEAAANEVLAFNERHSDVGLYAVLNQADIATKRQLLTTAGDAYQEVIRQAGENSSLKAQAQAGLANLHARQGNDASAESFYQRAIISAQKAQATFREDVRVATLTFVNTIYDDYIRFLVDRNRPQAACAIAEMSRAQTLTEGLGLRKPVSEASFASLDTSCPRPVRGVVLSYWLARGRSYLWILTPSTVVLEHLPDEEYVYTRVVAYRAAVRGPIDLRSTNNALGRELFDMLVTPAAPWLERTTDVTVIPDGALCQLNFETLLVSDEENGTSQYWVQSMLITYTSAMTMKKSNGKAASRRGRRAGPPAKERALIMGDPIQPQEYAPLPYAADEIDEIMSHYEEEKRLVLTGKNATPSAYFAANPKQFDVIFFVAHATADRASPLDSAIVLSSDGTSHNLLAKDIARTPLTARLVIISTCDSAGQAYAGEGLVGLAWAFLRAGTDEVIASLWQVDDRFTARLMGHMHARLAAGDTPAEALRAAKLHMLASQTAYSRPAYWAPFLAYS